MEREFKEIVEEITENLADTLVRKNHDYGDSFHKQYCKHGLIVSLLRLEEKLDRLESITNSKNILVDETIDDTLLDIAGYAILTLVTREKLSEKLSE